MFVKKSIALALSLMLVLTACVSQSPQPFKSTVTNSSRLHFTGKGAGAGMMLMSVMGAAGIAIGIAIDEGIAKELAKTAEQGGVFVDPLVEEGLRQQALSFPVLNNVDVEIKKYGFVIAPAGVGVDATAAQLHLRIRKQGTAKDQLIRYPEDFSFKTNATLAVGNLEQLKVDASLIQDLWRDAVEQVAACFVESCAK